jgi:hypothetical protein
MIGSLNFDPGCGEEDAAVSQSPHGDSNAEYSSLVIIFDIRFDALDISRNISSLLR